MGSKEPVSMRLRERLFARFQQIGTGRLRLRSEVADEFAAHVADAHDGIHVVAELCTCANGLQSATLHAMLQRWLPALREYEMPRRILEGKPGEIAAFRDLDQATALFCHSRVFEVCISQRKLAESQARQVATYITATVSGFFAYEQACRAPEDHTQRELCSLLRAVVGRPLVQAQAAAALYLGKS